jgi:hypothetical protein
MNARVAFAISLMYGLLGVGILLTSQCLLSASAQDGFGAAQDKPTAATRAETHLHNYGEFDKACTAWTDGCRNCKRDGSCSKIGIACQPREVTCLQHLPLEKNER